MRYLLLALLLSACGCELPPDARPLNDHEKWLLKEASREWDARNLGQWNMDCHDDARASYILYVHNDERWREETGYCSPATPRNIPCDYAVIGTYERYYWGPDEGPLYTIWYDSDRENVLWHEYKHWLSHCTTGDPDKYHEDPAIWSWTEAPR